MIVDTSAMIACLLEEESHEPIFRARMRDEGLLPAPALVEYRRMASRGKRVPGRQAERFLADLLEGPLTVLAFTPEHARVAGAANELYGEHVGPGGTLNLLDLMVYACALVERRPILCTGKDFAATDAKIHSASRTADPDKGAG